jgi:hypothetical protein
MISIIVLVVIIFTIYPFFLKTDKITYKKNPKLKQETKKLEMQKEETYSVLKELEFDYLTNKLSKKDYEGLKKSYEQKAINILKELDDVKKGKKKKVYKKVLEDDEIEKEILKYRKLKKEKEKVKNICSSCETEYEIGDKFCRECGTSLIKKQLLCTKCGTEYQEGDKFCIHCGGKL